MHVKPSTSECPKSDDEKEFMSKIPYQSIVGNLMYDMIATRLGIVFLMGIVSWFLWNLGKKYLEAIKMIVAQWDI